MYISLTLLLHSPFCFNVYILLFIHAKIALQKFLIVPFMSPFYTHTNTNHTSLSLSLSLTRTKNSKFPFFHLLRYCWRLPLWAFGRSRVNLQCWSELRGQGWKNPKWKRIWSQNQVKSTPLFLTVRCSFCSSLLH